MPTYYLATAFDLYFSKSPPSDCVLRIISTASEQGDDKLKRLMVDVMKSAVEESNCVQTETGQANTTAKVKLIKSCLRSFFYVILCIAFHFWFT